MWPFGKKTENGEDQYAAGMSLLKTNTTKANQTAFSHFSKAAQCGHIGAILEMGFSYFKGRGVEKNDGKAIEYYKLASDL